MGPRSAQRMASRPGIVEIGDQRIRFTRSEILGEISDPAPLKSRRNDARQHSHRQ
jgi:hypothetical protein